MDHRKKKAAATGCSSAAGGNAPDCLRIGGIQGGRQN